jgi:hypothetical protein
MSRLCSTLVLEASRREFGELKGERAGATADPLGRLLTQDRSAHDLPADKADWLGRKSVMRAVYERRVAPLVRDA